VLSGSASQFNGFSSSSMDACAADRTRSGARRVPRSHLPRGMGRRSPARLSLAGTPARPR
jgi:hypothetical protein